MEYFIFGGVDSRNYNVYLHGTGAYNAPARSYEFVDVPGRSGGLLLGGDSYGAIELVYPAFVVSDFAASIRGLRNALLTKRGYQRLTDSFSPDEYRMAAFAGPLEMDTVYPASAAGSVDLTFVCKPQRYLLSGDTPVTFSASGTLTNPEGTTARPLIAVTGTGSFEIGSTTVTISEASGVTYIDSDLMEIYDSNGSNRAAYVTMTDHAFPVLEPGDNGITVDGVSLSVTPRWWRL